MCFNCKKGMGVLPVGMVLDERYEILSVIGQGGMGIVYKALDRSLDEIVAVKMLRAELATDAAVSRRFRNEIKLARRVGHRNVCRIFEYGETHGLRYIAMEYVEGIDLRDLMQRQGLFSIEEALDAVIQATAGLAAIHEAGIVHRDLKTRNIMRDNKGVVRLMDFGIAKSSLADGGLNATGTGFIVGTPEYMSPEQGRGEKVDFRSDLYSMGIVIFEVFTGELPFRGDTPLAIIFRHLQEPPPLDGPLAKRLPEPIKPLLARVLAKHPHERHSTTEELLDALIDARSATFPDAGPAAVTLGRAHRSPADTRSASEARERQTPTPAPVAAGRSRPTAEHDAEATAITPPEEAVVGAPLPVRRLATPPSRPAVRDEPTARGPALAGAMTDTPKRSVTTHDLATYRGSAAADRRPGAAAGWRTIPLARVALIVLLAALVVGSAGLVRRILRGGQDQRSDTAALLSPSSTLTDDRRVADPAASETPAMATSPPTAALARVAPPASTPARSAARPSPRTPAEVAPVVRSNPTLTPSRTPTPVPSETPAPTPTPAPPTPTPAPPAVSVPVKESPGFLQVGAIPWAEVTVDGKAHGQTPLPRLALSPGAHVVVLNHPQFRPYRRTVQVRPGETVELVVNLNDVGLRK